MFVGYYLPIIYFLEDAKNFDKLTIHYRIPKSQADMVFVLYIPKYT